MKNDRQTPILLSGVAALMLAAGMAVAAAPEKDPGQQSPQSPPPATPATQSLDAIDTSNATMASTAQEKFDALDANRDAAIDKLEADASPALAAEFVQLDTDKNGKLSLVEFNSAKNMAAIKIKSTKKGY